MVNLLKRVFSLDLKSIAFFRIGLGLLILFDLINRARDLKAHYSDYGVLPRDVLLEKFMNKWYISIHLISGEVLIQGILFLIAAVFALMLIIGYKTRFSVIMSWFLLISLQSRNPMVLQGGDVFLRIILFWAMFLPLSAYYSIDCLNKIKSNQEKIFSVGTLGIFLSFISLYIFNNLMKNGSYWWPDGTAVYYALSIDQFTTLFGNFLLNFPDLLIFATYFIKIFFFLGPVMLLLSFKSSTLRSVTVMIFILLHLGIAASMKLGLFSFIMVVALIIFLPSNFWNKFIGTRRLNKFSKWFNKLRLNNKELVRENLNLKIIINIVGIFFIVYMLLWNISGINYGYVPKDFEFVGPLFRVDQKWNMFAPYPLTDDGWYVIPGNLSNGVQVELFNYGKKISYEKPECVSCTYKNQRWRKYMMNLWQRSNSDHRLYYGKYLCNEWNSKHSGEETLQTFEIIFMKEETFSNGESDPTPITIWNHDCFLK